MGCLPEDQPLQLREGQRERGRESWGSRVREGEKEEREGARCSEGRKEEEEGGWLCTAFGQSIPGTQ